MNPDKCNIDAKRIDNCSGTSSSAKDTKSASSDKTKLNQKVCWIATPEKEIYRTVVVNFRYGKIDMSNSCINTSATMKEKNWSPLIANLYEDNDEAEYENEDDVPNLQRLYDSSKKDLSGTTMPSCENVAKSRKEMLEEEIKLQVYCLPLEPKAMIEEQQMNTIKKDEVSLRLLSDNGPKDHGESKLQESQFHELYDSANKSSTKPNLAYTSSNNFAIFLRDHEIDETPEFEADFCCAITKDIVDGTQQTCIIKNKTKATQKPERQSEHLQTKRRRSRSRTVNDSNQKENENYLELTLAEIPKQDTDKSKKPPIQGGGLRLRQQELHRYRVAVEQKRLELLEIKIQRERDEMLHEQILFEKELEIKPSQL